jgi:hypothetical protein
VLSGVPQGYVMGPFLFHVFINDLCNYIKHARYLLFADGINIYFTVNSVTDCKFLQTDIDGICGWLAANCMKFSYDRTNHLYKEN